MIESNNAQTVLEFYNPCLWIIHTSALCCFGGCLCQGTQIFCWSRASAECSVLKNSWEVWGQLCVCLQVAAHERVWERQSYTGSIKKKETFSTQNMISQSINTSNSLLSKQLYLQETKFQLNAFYHLNIFRYIYAIYYLFLTLFFFFTCASSTCGLLETR